MHAPQRRWWNVIYMDLEFNDPDSHYPAVVLLTSQWRVFYHVNHTFHQLVKSNSLNEPTVMCVFLFLFFLCGFGKVERCLVRSPSCFITDVARKEICVHTESVLHEKERSGLGFLCLLS